MMTETNKKTKALINAVSFIAISLSAFSAPAAVQCSSVMRKNQSNASQVSLRTQFQTQNLKDLRSVPKGEFQVSVLRDGSVELLDAPERSRLRVRERKFEFKPYSRYAPASVVGPSGVSHQFADNLRLFNLVPTPDGQYVLTEGRENKTRVLDINTWQEIDSISFEAVPNKIEVSADGKYVFASFGHGGPVYDVDVNIYNLKTKSLVRTIKWLDYNSPILTSDGKHVICALNRGNGIVVVNIESGQIVSRLAEPGTVGRMALAADGKTLVVTSSSYLNRDRNHTPVTYVIRVDDLSADEGL